MNIRYIFLISLLGFVSSTEFYSSVAHLKQSMSFLQSINVPQSMKTYIEVKEKQLKNVESWVNILKELSEESKDPSFDIEHPLNVYRFIRNHSLVYNQTLDILFRHIEVLERNAINLTKFENLLKKMPSETDLEEIVNGIFRIQDVYDISAYRLVNGQEYIGAASDLTAKQCHYIADRALTKQKYYRAREWINIAINLVKNKDDPTVPLHLLLEDASVIAFAAGNSKEALNITQQLLELNPFDRTARKLHMQYELHYNASSELERQAMEKRGLEPPAKKSYQRQMDLLCQGKSKMLKEELGKQDENLFCRYQSNDHPLLIVQPAKLEEVSRKPYIVIYHDFLGKGLMETLMENTKIRVSDIGPPWSSCSFQLQRSKLLDNGNLQGENERRISKSAVINNRKLERRVGDRVEAITGASRQSLEVLQVANYGVAGRYEIHEDFFPEYLVREGKTIQRFATFMIYLTDVKAGGATVFPRLSEAIFPKAGRAVLWYNTYRNGKPDTDMKHAACPTVVGDKWIATQWIWQMGNEFNIPCALNSQE